MLLCFNSELKCHTAVTYMEVTGNPVVRLPFSVVLITVNLELAPPLK